MTKKAPGKKNTLAKTPKKAPAKLVPAKPVKSADKKSGFNASKPQPMKPGSKGVSIRMYCQGLGDCFLLAFSPAAKSNSKDPIYVMIDCGVLIGTAEQNERMKQVVENIAVTTKGKVDLLIVTHEHWDHISGFQQAQHEFKTLIKFEQIWLAWTENPQDKTAQSIRKKQQEKAAKLKMALQTIKDSAHA